MPSHRLPRLSIRIFYPQSNAIFHYQVNPDPAAEAFLRYNRSNPSRIFAKAYFVLGGRFSCPS